MRQRYYNTEIKRFVNQDILTGSAAGSQSLNRYSYVQGNPVSYTDPFGLSPLNGLFSGSNVRHALLGLASCIPVIGFVASAADAWFYYREGNTAMAAACTVDAVIGLFGVTGSLLQMASKTRRVGKAIQIAAKIGNGGIGLYRNATTFGKSAVDFYMRHEGTFFTKDFRWELADAGDFLSMAVSGAGATTSAAGMASGISDAAKTYRQWKKIDALKNIGEGGTGALDIRNINGQRTSRYRQLSDDEISQLLDDIEALEADSSIYRFNEGNQTGFLDSEGIINVRGDVLPDLNSNHPRDLMSPRAVLAHEYYGHKHFDDVFSVRNPLPGSWNDEFRASYNAALNASNLSGMDRMYLMSDALERAKEAGVNITITDEIR